MSVNLTMTRGLFDTLTQRIPVKVGGFTGVLQLNWPPSGGNGPGHRVVGVNSPSFGNWFSTNENGEVLCSKNRVPKHPTGYVYKSPIVIKPSKLVTYLVTTLGIRHSVTGDRFSDPKILNRFVELMSSGFLVTCDYEIKISSDITAIYGKPTSLIGVGNLGKSCMRSEVEYKCKDYTALYGSLDVKVAYMEDDKGSLVGRALIWGSCKSQAIKAPFIMMDRVYGTEQTTHKFKAWAKKKGYWSKIYQSPSDPSIEKEGEDRVIRDYYLDVPEDLFKDRVTPYFDTFIYFNHMLNRLQTSNTFYMPKLQNCDGRVRMRDHVCARCGRLGEVFPTIGELRYCNECAVHSRYTDSWLLVNTVFWSDVEDSYIPQDIAVKLEDTGEYAVLGNTNTYTTVDGRYFNRRFSKSCALCGSKKIKEIPEPLMGNLLCKACEKAVGNQKKSKRGGTLSSGPGPRYSLNSLRARGEPTNPGPDSQRSTFTTSGYTLSTIFEVPEPIEGNPIEAVPPIDDEVVDTGPEIDEIEF